MHLNAAYLLLFFLCMHAVRMCERYGQRTRVIVDFPVPGQIQNATGQISTLFFTFFFFVPPHRLRLKRMTHEKNTEIKKHNKSAICWAKWIGWLCGCRITHVSIAFFGMARANSTQAKKQRLPKKLSACACTVHSSHTLCLSLSLEPQLSISSE